MSRLNIQYSALGERWTIDVVGREEVPAEPDEQGLVTIFRDVRGYVVSAVIDAAVPDADARRLVQSLFGAEVAAVMDETPEVDVDLSVEVEGSSSSELARTDLRVVGTTVGLIADEPGVPIPSDGDRYRVVLEVDVRVVDAVVERDLSSSRMRIEIGSGVGTEEMWVRVADGGTGGILAMAPMTTPGTHGESSSAEFVFGLEVPTQLLHFSVSDEPLSPPGSRDDRRRRWARRLESEAGKMRLPRGAQARLFEKASQIYDAVGDVDAADRNRRAARRARRRRGWVAGAGVLLIAATTAYVGFRLGGGGEGGVGGSDETITETLPEVNVPVDPGPVDLVFDDDQDAQLVVTGDGSVNPGDVLEFVVRARLRSSVTFERLIDCLGSESGNSLVGGDGPMYQPTFIPILENVTDPSIGARAFAPFSVDRSADTYFVLPGACRESWIEDGRPFDAAAIANYTPFSAQVTLPEDLEPGAWQLTLVLENVEGASTDGTYPTIVVTG